MSIDTFFEGDVKTSTKSEVKHVKKLVKRVEQERRQVDPIDALVSDRGYIIVERVYGRVGDETRLIALMCRDCNNQIHYICVFPIGMSRICGAEFFNIVDLVRHMYLVHQRSISEMEQLVDLLVRHVREHRVSTDLVRSVLPEELAVKILKRI